MTEAYVIDRKCLMLHQRRIAPSILFAACFVVVFLAVQILIPLAQLAWAPRPARFGWQMYSVASAAPRFELIMRDRSSKQLDITPYVTSLRGDVPLAHFLPPHLCQLFPD